MTRQILCVLVLPVVLACAIMFAARWAGHRATRVAVEPFGMGLAVAVGFMAAFVATEGWPAWPPAARWHWLPILAAFSVMVGLFASRKPYSLGALVGSAWLVGLAAAWMIRLPDVETMAWRLTLGAIVCGLCILIGSCSFARPGPFWLASMVVVFVTLSALFMIAHFSKMAMLAGCLAAIHGAATLPALRGVRLPVGAAWACVVAGLVPAFALTGYSYDYGFVPLGSWALVAASPCLLVVAIRLTPNSWPTFPRWAIAMGSVILPCAIAMLSCDFSDPWA